MMAAKSSLRNWFIFRCHKRDLHEIEALDPRRLLAAVAWDGGGPSDVWSDPLNWSADALPTAADDVTIGTGVPNLLIDSGLVQANSVVTSSPITLANHSSLQTGIFKVQNGCRITGGTLVPLGTSATLDVGNTIVFFDAMTLEGNWVM